MHCKQYRDMWHGYLSSRGIKGYTHSTWPRGSVACRDIGTVAGWSSTRSALHKNYKYNYHSRISHLK